MPVCPVQATYQRKDGIVVIDNKRFIGCAYCVQACPYDARFINSETKTADKCTFCHSSFRSRIITCLCRVVLEVLVLLKFTRIQLVQIRKMVDEFKDDLKVLKPDHGTIPHVFYLGLDDAFVNEVNGQPMLWQDKEKAE